MCCREMQVEFDDLFLMIIVCLFSFNYEIKNYEAKESLVFFGFVQNAFALLRKDSIGSKG